MDLKFKIKANHTKYFHTKTLRYKVPSHQRKEFSATEKHRKNTCLRQADRKETNDKIFLLHKNLLSTNNDKHRLR